MSGVTWLDNTETAKGGGEGKSEFEQNWRAAWDCNFACQLHLIQPNTWVPTYRVFGEAKFSPEWKTKKQNRVTLTTYFHTQKVSSFGKHPLNLAFANGVLLRVSWERTTSWYTYKLVLTYRLAFLSLFMPIILISRAHAVFFSRNKIPLFRRVTVYPSHDTADQREADLGSPLARNLLGRLGATNLVAFLTISSI